MGSCIICGAPADGHICDTHEEDVAFEFKGTRPNQLIPGRFYRGTVDGTAEFGVFVNIGERVTGLLHKSELDRRLESLNWKPGKVVYVQVTSIRDNGNVDLGWSIRQSDREFRGTLIQDPQAPTNAELPEEETKEEIEEKTEEESEPRSGRSSESKQATETESTSGRDGSSGDQQNEQTTANGGEHAVQVQHRDESTAAEKRERVAVEALSELVGEPVRLEGKVVGVRQTGGPTVFDVRDETAVVNCAAFVEAGVRAYPEVDVDDYVRLDGVVERHNNEIQVETDSLETLSDEGRAAVERRLDDAVAAEAATGDVPLLADLPDATAIHDEIRAAAEAIRRAVIESRPVLVRHVATAEGYLAGAAVERAVLPLIREKHTRSDAEYHYFDRRPLGGQFYDMDDATGDVTHMLTNRERHDEKLPLFVLVNAGSTVESRDGLRLLDIYDAKRVVVDTTYPDEEMADLTDVFVNPYLGDVASPTVTTSALGADVAAHVNPEVRDDVRHIPAASYWEDAPEAYTELASEAGYDGTETTQIREAVALEAYYQSYEDMRELITDILFEDDSRALAAYVSEQFRDKLETEIETVMPNLTLRGYGDVFFRVLDTDAFTHRFDFPSTDLLLDEVHRRERKNHDGVLVTLGVADDELHVRSTEPVDIRAIADLARESVPEAGLTARGTRDGKIEFLVGERDAVVDAVVDAIAERQRD